MRRSINQTAQYRERAAECASLASTANMPRTQAEYRELARHYLMLADAENQIKPSPAPRRRRKRGRLFKFNRTLVSESGI
jgi:hypothetical protein